MLALFPFDSALVFDPTPITPWPNDVVFPVPPGEGEAGGAYLAVPATYRVVRCADVLVSHTVGGRKAIPTEGYPRRVQHREYAGRRGQEAVDAVIAAGFALDPVQLLDLTATTAVGPPVVAEVGDDAMRYVVVVGNQRCMSVDVALHQAPARYDAYVRELARRAPVYGLGGAVRELASVQARLAQLRAEGASETALRAAAVLLVRVLDSAALPGGSTPSQSLWRALGRLNRASDSAGFTKTRDPVSLAHALASETRYLERDGAGPAGSDASTPLGYLLTTLLPGQSVGAYLRVAGGAFFQRLLDANVIGEYERTAYAVTHGRETPVLHAAGRLALERLVHALVFGDPEVLDEAPPILLDRLAAVMPSLLRLACGHPAWDVSRPLGLALRRLGALRRAAATNAAGPHTLVDALTQEAFARGDLEIAFLASPRAIALAQFLDARLVRRRHVGDAFGAWEARAQAVGAHTWREPDLEQTDMFAASPGGADDAALARAADAAFASVFRADALASDRLGGIPSEAEGPRPRSTRTAFAGLLGEDAKRHMRLWYKLTEGSGVAVPSLKHGLPERARPGAPRTHSDAQIFAQLCLSRHGAPDVRERWDTARLVERVDGLGLWAAARTCRRRVEAWSRDESVRGALVGVPELPDWVRAKLVKASSRAGRKRRATRGASATHDSSIPPPNSSMQPPVRVEHTLPQLEREGGAHDGSAGGTGSATG